MSNVFFPNQALATYIILPRSRQHNPEELLQACGDDILDVQIDLAVVLRIESDALPFVKTQKVPTDYGESQRTGLSRFGRVKVSFQCCRNPRPGFFISFVQDVKDAVRRTQFSIAEDTLETSP